MSIYKYGWKPQLPDFRDHKFTVERLASVQSVYLAQKYKMSVVYDQGNLGSCVGNGTAALVHFDLLNKHAQKVIAPWVPSRLLIYYNARVIEGTIDQDAGAEIRNGIKAIATNGVCSEDAWPYNIEQFATQPSSYAINLAKAVTAIKYQSVDNTNKQLLINALLQGYPIVFGMTVYESFESDAVTNTGIVPMPNSSEQTLGGHCMSIFGYRKEDDSFIVKNSWGTDWGQKGYCRIPAAYLTNSDLADDFWIIETVL